MIDLPNTALTAGTIYDVVAVGQVANIRAEVATFTPTAAGAAGEAQAMMPATGAFDSLQLVLVALGLALLIGGVTLRVRRA
ncbi:MAG TPA: hypothetical protein VLA19_33105 [Herpetosiphonaceae bacterium]|nr:hypothetical protein [Herpetosiphonaceae bacterium]